MAGEGGLSHGPPAIVAQRRCLVGLGRILAASRLHLALAVTCRRAHGSDSFRAAPI